MADSTESSASVVDNSAGRLLARKRWAVAGISLAVLLVLAGIGAAVYFLLQDGELTARLRDIFIVFLALESLVVGAAVIILVLQIAVLINLLQNEIRPILEATNETVNTLRGTSEFLSENLVEPVIKLNSALAGIRKFIDIFSLWRK